MPGVLVMLGHWFAERDRASSGRRAARFRIAGGGVDRVVGLEVAVHRGRVDGGYPRGVRCFCS